MCLNPTDFYGFVYSKSDPNKGWTVLGDTGIWVVEFTESGKLLVRNQNFMVKTLYFMSVTQTQACDSYEYIANPQPGHYFLVSDKDVKSDYERNLTMSSNEYVCLFYIGPAIYNLHIKNTGPLFSYLYVDAVSQSSETTKTVETSYIIEYITTTITPSGYSFVQITNGTYIDQYLDTGMRRASNENVLVVSGDNAKNGQIKSIVDYEKEHNFPIINEINNNKILFIVVITVIILIIIILICCCCRHKGSSPNNYQNRTNTLQTELIQSNSGVGFGYKNPYEIYQI